MRRLKIWSTSNYARTKNSGSVPSVTIRLMKFRLWDFAQAGGGRDSVERNGSGIIFNSRKVL